VPDPSSVARSRWLSCLASRSYLIRDPAAPIRWYPSSTKFMDAGGASGMETDRLTLSQLVDKSPSSSVFHNLILASRAYGLTTGGKNADEFGLTAVGRLAVSDDPAERTEGLRKAVLTVDPFRAFLAAYDKKKVPQPVAFSSGTRI
jgi:hypothetical protein